MCSQYILHLLDFDFAHCDDGCIFTFKGMLLKIALFSFITTKLFHIQQEYRSCQQFLFQKKDLTYWLRIFFGTIKVRLIEVCCHPVSWLRTLSSSAGLPLEGWRINTVFWYWLAILKLNGESETGFEWNYDLTNSSEWLLSEPTTEKCSARKEESGNSDWITILVRIYSFFLNFVVSFDHTLRSTLLFHLVCAFEVPKCA